MGAEPHRRSGRRLRLERPKRTPSGSVLCRRRQFARLSKRRHWAPRYDQRRRSRRSEVLCRFRHPRGAARATQGARVERTRLYRFRHSVSNRADQHCVDSCPARANGRPPAASRTKPRYSRECRYRGIVEVSGRSGPPRSCLPDQERGLRQDPNFQSQLRDEVLMLLFYFRLAALFSLFLCCLAGSAMAQAPPAPSAPAQETPPPAPLPTGQNLTVMVVDVQALLQNSKAAKMVRSQIEQKRGEYTKDISHQEESLRAERDALQRQQASLSPEALNQKGRDFQQKVNDLERNVQGKRQALEKSNGDALQRIQEEMLKIIADIAKQRKANLVFQRTDLVLFDQAFDVTDEVLQKLDEQMPTLTVNFVAPVPPSASASPPAPAAPSSPAAPNPKPKKK